MHISRERSAKVSSVGHRVIPSIYPSRYYKVKDETQSLDGVFQRLQTALLQHAILLKFNFPLKVYHCHLLARGWRILYDLESRAHRSIPAALQTSPEIKWEILRQFSWAVLSGKKYCDIIKGNWTRSKTSFVSAPSY